MSSRSSTIGRSSRRGASARRSNSTQPRSPSTACNRAACVQRARIASTSRSRPSIAPERKANRAFALSRKRALSRLSESVNTLYAWNTGRGCQFRSFKNAKPCSAPNTSIVASPTAAFVRGSAYLRASSSRSRSRIARCSPSAVAVRTFVATLRSWCDRERAVPIAVRRAEPASAAAAVTQRTGLNARCFTLGLGQQEQAPQRNPKNDLGARRAREARVRQRETRARDGTCAIGRATHGEDERRREGRSLRRARSRRRDRLRARERRAQLERARGQRGTFVTLSVASQRGERCAERKPP